MSRTFLVFGIGAQLVLLLALALALVWYRFWGAVDSHRRGREREQLETALTAYRTGEEGPEAVARAAGEVSLLALHRLLEDRLPELADGSRAELVEALRTGAWRDRVRRSASSRFWWKRLTAAESLLLLGESREAPLVVRLARDDHAAVFTTALLAARRVRPAGLPKLLLDRLEGSSAHQHRGLYLDVLAAYGEDLLPVLRERLDRPASEQERSVHLQVAARLGARELRADVAELARDAQKEVRIDAVRVLGDWGAVPDVLEALTDALEDPAWQVRTQAASALGSLADETGRRELLDQLRRALDDPSWWVRLRAALSLYRLGPEGRRELEAAAAGEDRYPRDMASYVLGLDEAAIAELQR